MRTEQITIRLTEDERKMIKKAAVKFHQETGEKESITKAVVRSIGDYLNNDKIGIIGSTKKE